MGDEKRRELERILNEPEPNVIVNKDGSCSPIGASMDSKHMQVIVGHWAEARKFFGHESLHAIDSPCLDCAKLAHLLADALAAEAERVLKTAYLAARGTDKLKERGNSQMYWKGRADAANDVRALADQPRQGNNKPKREATEATPGSGREICPSCSKPLGPGKGGA